MVVCIINNKGGVSKTTTSCNLSHALAIRGKKVLVIDQDPQSNLTSTLLSKLPSGQVYNTLFDLYSGREIEAKDCIYQTQYEGLFVMPNLAITASLEHAMYQDIKTSYMLGRKIIDKIEHDFDFIFYDCPPTLGLWVLMALISSDCAIIPVTVGSKYALDGLVAAIDAIEGVSNTVNANLKFLRLLISRVDLRTNSSKVTVDFIKSRFGPGKVFNTTIHENTKIQQAELAGKTVISHAPQSRGSQGYYELADEFLKIVGCEQPGLSS